MHPVKAKKIASTILGFTLLLTLLLTILNLLIISSYATEWFSIPDIRLTWDRSGDWAPSIAQAQDERIWFLWHSSDIGTNPDILYKVYNGSTFPWSPTKKLTTHPSTDMNPSITTTTDGNLWVVWSTNRTGNFEIYYKIYNGSSWSPATRLTNNTSRDESPSVMQDKDDNLWVVWSSDRTGNFEIHYQIYNNQTKNWQPEGQITSNPSTSDRDPSIMQAQDDTFWVVWKRVWEKEEDLWWEDLCHKIIFKNMTAKFSDTLLTKDSNIDLHPSIMQTQAGAIWIAWATERQGNQTDIYCRIIYNSSVSDEQITYNNKDDLLPAIMQAADGKIWIAWTSIRLDNFDIYYKTDSPPKYRHDVAIVSFTYDPIGGKMRVYDGVTCACQGLNISIEIVSQNQGMEFEDFTVRCYVNSTLIGSQELYLMAGQLTPVNFIWNTLETAPGTYNITAKLSMVHGEIDITNNDLTSGLIQMRLQGDADFNGVVEMDDYCLWVENLGNTPSQCPPGIYPDFDNNGWVELMDYLVWRRHLGAQHP